MVTNKVLDLDKTAFQKRWEVGCSKTGSASYSFINLLTISNIFMALFLCASYMLEKGDSVVKRLDVMPLELMEVYI